MLWAYDAKTADFYFSLKIVSMTSVAKIAGMNFTEMKLSKNVWKSILR
jgi:hypothetical protein